MFGFRLEFVAQQEFTLQLMRKLNSYIIKNKVTKLPEHSDYISKYSHFILKYSNYICST